LLNREHRPLPAKEYLEKIYNTYIKLTESSNFVKKSIKDALSEVTITPPSTPTRTQSGDLEWGLSIVHP
jgi:hypothetical protein